MAYLGDIRILNILLVAFRTIVSGQMGAAHEGHLADLATKRK